MYEKNILIKKLAIFANAIFIAVTVTGQSNFSHSKPIRQFGIDVGGLHYQIRDDIIAPLRWDGLGFVADFSYSIIGNKSEHNIDLRIPVAFPHNRYDHRSTVAEINLGYGYVHRIASSESLGRLYLGGLIDWSYNFQYYNNWDDSHMYWLNAYELGPTARWSNTIRDIHQLGVNVNFPLVALVSRPPKHRYYDQERLPREVLSKPHKEMEFTSVHKYLSFGLKGYYMYRVSRKITMGASYHLNYKTFSEPERIRLFANSLQLKLIFTRGNTKREKS